MAHQSRHRQSDGIIVYAYPQNPPVTAQNISAVILSFEPELRRAQAARRSLAGAALGKITMGGLPGFEGRNTGRSFTGTPGVIRRIYAFDGTTGYLVACQHTRKRAAEVERACEHAGEQLRKAAASLAGRPHRERVP